MNRIEAVNDFVVKFANVNGSGSASANELFAKAVLRGSASTGGGMKPMSIRSLAAPESAACPFSTTLYGGRSDI